MKHGRLPRLARILYLHWSIFWLKRQQEDMVAELALKQKRWSGLPAEMDRTRDNISAITVEIGELEQELI